MTAMQEDVLTSIIAHPGPLALARSLTHFGDPNVRRLTTASLAACFRSLEYRCLGRSIVVPSTKTMLFAKITPENLEKQGYGDTDLLIGNISLQQYRHVFNQANKYTIKLKLFQGICSTLVRTMGKQYATTVMENISKHKALEN